MNLKMMKPTKNQLFIGVAILAVILTGVVFFSGSRFNFSNGLPLKIGSNMSADEIAKKSIDYLNKSILQEGQTAELVSSSEESGVVKIKIKIGGNTYDSYATKDGKLLFPEAFNLEANPQDTAIQSN